MKRILILIFLFSYLASIEVGIADNESGWYIDTSSKENYNGVTLANGRIGLVSGPELFSVSVFSWYIAGK